MEFNLLEARFLGCCFRASRTISSLSRQNIGKPLGPFSRRREKMGVRLQRKWSYAWGCDGDGDSDSVCG